MRKIYIAPETEQLRVIKEAPLCAGTVKGDTYEGGSTPTPSDGDPNEPPEARQHNNWMWDTMEDEY